MFMKTFNRVRGREPTEHLEKGRQAEQLARRFLIDNGMKHIQSNYRCRCGEIDLIMEDKEYIVFVEVRFRGSQRYGGALASVGRQKVARLRKTAQHFLQRFDPAGHRPCRFDLLAPKTVDAPGWVWIRNAF